MTRASFLCRLLCLLVACMIIEGLFAFVYRQLPYEKAEDLRLIQRTEKMQDPTAYDLLILGDSTAMQGMNPRVIEQQTGFSAYNVATYRNIAAFTDPILLERYLQHHPHPKAILVGRSITMWQQPQQLDTVWEYFFNANVLDAALPSFPFGLEAKLKIHLSVVSQVFRNWHSFRRRVTGKHQEQQVVTDTMRTIESHKGQRVSTGSSLSGVTSDVLRDDFYTFPVENTILLSYLCTQAVENTIPLFMVTPPHAPADGYTKDTDPFPTAYDGYIERVLSFTDARSAYCHYLRSPAFARPSELSDGLHLNQTGSILYSAYLGRALKELLR